MIEQKYTKDKMPSNKMKGLLKGLRYISQIFENGKEPQIQIGHPTDVKHVAHIGLDGPSVNAPSWMNEFKSSPGFASDHLAKDAKDDSSVRSVSKDSSRRSGRVRDSPGLPKSSKKSASGSPTKEKSDKTKRRPSTKDASDGSSRRFRRSKEPFGQDEDSSFHRNGLPEISKRSKRNKSKDSVGGGSSRSSRRAHASESDQMLDCMSETGSIISISHYDDERREF